MSLKVWLPLNGDFRNQGLSNYVIANNGASFDNNGKFGRCLKTPATDNTGMIDLGYNGNQVNTGSISFGGWFKFNKAEIQSVVGSYNYDSTRSNPIGNLIGNSSYGGVALVWATNNLYSDNGVVNNIYVYCTLRSTQNGARSTSSISLDFDTWYNIYLVFNKETKMLQLWVNGILRQYTAMVDFSDARDLSLKLNYRAIWGGNGPAFNIPFYTNDVRIYDHALSPLEMKKISQGLALHYKLSDLYVEATTNLATTEDCLSNTFYNSARSKYGYNATSDGYKVVGVFEGKKCTKVYMGTPGESAQPYPYIANMYVSNGTNAPEYKTVSFDYFGTIGEWINPYKLGSGSATCTWTNSVGESRSGSYENSGRIAVVPGIWNHITMTLHGTTDANAEWGYIILVPTHTSSLDNYWLFANLQIEAKDHATGYAGVGGSRDGSEPIYDCSGFNNHGTKSGTFSIKSDTPRYAVSTYMPTASLITHARPVDNNNQEWTCCMWVKLDGTSQTGQHMNNFNEGNRIVHSANGTSLLYLNSGTNDYYMYGSQAVSAGVWTHVAFVFRNSDGTRNVYINGVLKNNYGPNKTSTPKGILDTVTVGTNLAGYISDYRVYATALSADDIKALYEISATVENNGKFYSYEVVEG